MMHAAGELHRICDAEFKNDIPQPLFVRPAADQKHEHFGNGCTKAWHSAQEEIQAFIGVKRTDKTKHKAVAEAQGVARAFVRGNRAGLDKFPVDCVRNDSDTIRYNPARDDFVAKRIAERAHSVRAAESGRFNLSR